MGCWNTPNPENYEFFFQSKLPECFLTATWSNFFRWHSLPSLSLLLVMRIYYDCYALLTRLNPESTQT